MRLAKFLIPPDPTVRVGLLDGATLQPLEAGRTLSDWLSAPNPSAAIAYARSRATEPPAPRAAVRLLPPVDAQEIWGAGVTYERSKVARQEESEGGGSFYDQVYTADRPELFFKATAARVSGPGQPIRVRADSSWTVPEPELALVMAPDLRLVGFTIGNDVSARDIEGKNPLYLPQAKVYRGGCALGPCVTLPDAMPAENAIEITLEVRRGESVAFEGATTTARLARRFAELIDWLGRENCFPDGAILLTGTGIVPPDEFRLEPGDQVKITIDGIGTLVNPVAS